MRAVLTFIVLAVCLARPGHATDTPGAGTHSADVKAIQTIVEQFRAAIITVGD